jgi:hypothetical protein
MKVLSYSAVSGTTVSEKTNESASLISLVVSWEVTVEASVRRIEQDDIRILILAIVGCVMRFYEKSSCERMVLCLEVQLKCEETKLEQVSTGQAKASEKDAAR